MQQLKLFPDSEIGSLYKPGDWVKVLRKPKNGFGAYLKRGDIVQVAATNPADGSIKFWNKHFNGWDYLYPENFKLCPQPKAEVVVEEPPTAEIVVEELATAEIVVEEMKFNSSSTTTRKILPIDTDSSTTSSGWITAHYKIRTNGKQHSIAHWEPNCTGPYYSYRWQEGKRQRGKYLPQSKVSEITSAIEKGLPPAEILKLW